MISFKKIVCSYFVDLIPSFPSLQATWIRNSIIHAFRETSVPVQEVQPTFVFSNPSIRALATATSRIGQRNLQK